MFFTSPHLFSFFRQINCPLFFFADQMLFILQLFTAMQRQFG
jgi:hypothetical protein